MKNKMEMDFRCLLAGSYDFVKSLRFILDAAGYRLSWVAKEAGVDPAEVSRALPPGAKDTAAGRRVRHVINSLLGFNPWKEER